MLHLNISTLHWPCAVLVFFVDCFAFQKLPTHRTPFIAVKHWRNGRPHRVLWSHRFHLWRACPVFARYLRRMASFHATHVPVKPACARLIRIAASEQTNDLLSSGLQSRVNWQRRQKLMTKTIRGHPLLIICSLALFIVNVDKNILTKTRFILKIIKLFSVPIIFPDNNRLKSEVRLVNLIQPFMDILLEMNPRAACKIVW